MFKNHFAATVATLTVIALVVLISNRSVQPAVAMTAHGTDKKTMVTVPLDAGMEAVVTLDHQTGDMTGYVLNRTNGQFFIRYRHNVTADFPNHGGAYLMATGLADFRGFDTNARIASGVVYVSEESSRRVIAYGLPWNPRFSTSGAPNQNLQFVVLDQAATRFSPVR